MSDPQKLASPVVIFAAAALFAYAGWYHFFNTRKLCESISKDGWPRFLAKAYSGKLACSMYKAGGVVMFAVSLFLIVIGVLRILNR